MILKNTRLSKKPINNTCNVSYEILKTTKELPDGNHIHLAINNLANDLVKEVRVFSRFFVKN